MTVARRRTRASAKTSLESPISGPEDPRELGRVQANSVQGTLNELRFTANSAPPRRILPRRARSRLILPHPTRLHQRLGATR